VTLQGAGVLQTDRLTDTPRYGIIGRNKGKGNEGKKGKEGHKQFVNFTSPLPYEITQQR